MRLQLSQMKLSSSRLSVWLDSQQDRDSTPPGHRHHMSWLASHCHTQEDNLVFHASDHTGIIT